MNMDNEPVEKFLKGLSLPEYESEEHRRRLRGRVLARLEADRSARFGRGWKTAALLLGLLCAAGAATEVAKVAIEANRVRLEGRGRDGSGHFKTEPRTPDDDQNAGGSITSSGNGELDAAGIERLRLHFEEIEVLRQKVEERQFAALREQSRREVDMIIETEHSMAISSAR